MTPEHDAQDRQDTRSVGQSNLDRQYRSIGISAVAAALPYAGDTKNPAHAYKPAVTKDDDRFEEAA